MNNYYGNTWAEDARPSEHLPVGVVNAFLQRVFTIMSLGLGITGLAAWFFFKYFFTEVSGELALTAAGQAVFTTPIRYVVMFAPFAFVLVLSFGIQKLSYAAASVIFALFAAVMGMSLSAIFALYTTGSIALTFFITAGTFGAMALYGLTTKTDLSKMGSILMMALFGLIIASLVNYFMKSSMMDFIISIVGVLIFTGLTAYDVQRIMRESLTMDADSETAGKASVMGALTLYLDFINLFLFLLRLLGNRK